MYAALTALPQFISLGLRMAVFAVKLLIVRSSPVLNLKFILCIYGFLHILQYFNCIIYIYAGSCGPYAGQMVRTVKSSSISVGIRNRNVNNGGSRRISIGSARSGIVGRHFLNLE